MPSAKTKAKKQAAPARSLNDYDAVWNGKAFLSGKDAETLDMIQKGMEIPENFPRVVRISRLFPDRMALTVKAEPPEMTGKRKKKQPPAIYTAILEKNGETLAEKSLDVFPKSCEMELGNSLYILDIREKPDTPGWLSLSKKKHHVENLEPES